MMPVLPSPIVRRLGDREGRPYMFLRHTVPLRCIR